MGTRELPESLNHLSERIIGCAIEVHRALGPGLLERIYQEAMEHELKLQGLAFARQVPVAMRYKGIVIVGQRLDLVVENQVVVELKSVESVIDVYLAQLVGYMKAGKYPLGLVVNFNVPVLRKGVFRRIYSKALSIPATLPISAASA